MSGSNKRSLERKYRLKKSRSFFCINFLVFCLCIIPPPGISFAKRIPSIDIEEEEVLEVYETVFPSKALSTSPQFKVIDDFNSADLKNRLGGVWHLKGKSEGKIRLTNEKQDSRNKKRGHSLKISFDILKNKKFSFQSSLEKLDISKAKYLAMKCKVESPNQPIFKGRIRVSIEDWKNKKVIRDITEACRETKEWNDVILPLSFFKGIDFDQLKNIKFSVLSRNQSTEGELWLDEIAFFGLNEVAFESHRDNFVGFPKTILALDRTKRLKSIKNDRVFLRKIAQDTWAYFKNAADKDTHLVSDNIRLGDAPLAANYTSITNIAMDLMGTVAAKELGFISEEDAEERVGRILKTLQKMDRWNGFFYNFYNTTKLNITRDFISAVDSGWLAVALVVVRQTFGKYYKQATNLLDDFDFEKFLDFENNQLAIGIEPSKNELTPFHYGLIMSEARATSFYAIGKGDIDKEHWWYIYRTAPESWRWQEQEPKGEWTEHDGIPVFQGYYEYMNKKFLPSWGGSLFEFLMPTLVLQEKTLAARNFGLNNKRVTELHRDYALKEKKYPVWGISPAATTNGKRWQYGEFGVKKTGVKGYPDKGVITPHVSFLALEVLPKDAIENIRKMLNFNMYGEYGFYDSVDVNNKKVNTQYLALDQGMILIAIANYLKDGAIQKTFHKDPIAIKASKLWEEESFFRD